MGATYIMVLNSLMGSIPLLAHISFMGIKTRVVLSPNMGFKLIMGVINWMVLTLLMDFTPYLALRPKLGFTCSLAPRLIMGFNY